MPDESIHLMLLRMSEDLQSMNQDIKGITSRIGNIETILIKNENRKRLFYSVLFLAGIAAALIPYVFPAI